MTNSPYLGLDVSMWAARTDELIAGFPTTTQEVVEVVLHSWAEIFESSFGSGGFRIGQDIFPQPQILGFFLHELIPLELERRYPALWTTDKTGYGKDIVCLADPKFSCEIKTSSHKSKIFGNRSQGQVGVSSKKDKSGFYLAVNFEHFNQVSGRLPEIRKIRIGWLDGADWQGQRASTGQQANLSNDVERLKLKTLFERSST